jgi:hypothetical protein
MNSGRTRRCREAKLIDWLPAHIVGDREIRQHGRGNCESPVAPVGRAVTHRARRRKLIRIRRQNENGLLGPCRSPSKRDRMGSIHLGNLVAIRPDDSLRHGDAHLKRADLAAARRCHGKAFSRIEEQWPPLSSIGAQRRVVIAGCAWREGNFSGRIVVLSQEHSPCVDPFFTQVV